MLDRLKNSKQIKITPKMEKKNIEIRFQDELSILTSPEIL